MEKYNSLMLWWPLCQKY